MIEDNEPGNKRNRETNIGSYGTGYALLYLIHTASVSALLECAMTYKAYLHIYIYTYNIHNIYIHNTRYLRYNDVVAITCNYCCGMHLKINFPPGEGVQGGLQAPSGPNSHALRCRGHPTDLAPPSVGKEWKGSNRIKHVT